MKSERPWSGWILSAALLAAVITVSGVIIAVNVGGDRPVEITLAPQEPLAGRVYVGGAVNNPGYYPLRSGDGMEDILAAAGGLAAGADLGEVQLVIVPGGNADAAQKVDLNRADLWLLEALPGVGQARAQAIVDYRREHGPFRDIHELTGVPGFGEATFEAIRDLITVAGSAE
jgi:competence protein ComEA